MNKYINADRLRAEIEKTYKSEIQPWLSSISAKSAIYDWVLPLIDVLQREQPEPPTCKSCDFYENDCPFIRDKFIPYPNRVCKDYTSSVMKEQEQPIGEEYAIEIGKETHTLRVGSRSDINRLIAQEKQEE